MSTSVHDLPFHLERLQCRLTRNARYGSRAPFASTLELRQLLRIEALEEEVWCGGGGKGGQGRVEDRGGGDGGGGGEGGQVWGGMESKGV